MKKSTQKPLQILSLATKSISFPISSSAVHSITDDTEPKPNRQTQSQILTQEELTKINLLLPRLCLLNHIDTATQLAITAILTNPPLQSLSLSPLIHHFTSQPDTARPMSLLTRLRHNPPSHPHLTPIAAMLIASYFRKKKPRDAFRMFHWLVRPGSPCVLDRRVCEVLVVGFCRNGMIAEALKVLRAMLGANITPGPGLGKWVYRGLLREARIKEAVELNQCLTCVGDGKKCEESQDVKKVLALLDHMIGNWTE